MTQCIKSLSYGTTFLHIRSSTRCFCQIGVVCVGTMAGETPSPCLVHSTLHPPSSTLHPPPSTRALLLLCPWCGTHFEVKQKVVHFRCIVEWTCDGTWLLFSSVVQGHTSPPPAAFHLHILVVSEDLQLHISSRDTTHLHVTSPESAGRHQGTFGSMIHVP